MIDNEVFVRELKRLELANGRALPPGAYQVWWDQVKRRRFKEGALIKAINMLIESDNPFPRLADIIKYCGAERSDELKQERVAQQRANEARQTKDWTENAGKRGGRIAGSCLELIHGLHAGLVSAGKGFYDGMLTLHAKYPHAGFKRQADNYLREYNGSTASSEIIDTRTLTDKVRDAQAEAEARLLDDVPF